jgi:hypothetical protein
MTAIYVLLLTIWLNNGLVTARALITVGDLTDCQSDGNDIAALMKGQELTVAGKKVTIKTVTTNCIPQSEPTSA